MAKRRKRRKKSPATAPSSIRGGEKWRVAGIRGNTLNLLKSATTLSVRERKALETIVDGLDLILEQWIDKEPAR